MVTSLERDRDQWPQFRTEGAEFVFNKIKGFSEFTKQKRLDLVICLYTDEFIIKNTGEKALTELEKLIYMLKETGVIFMTTKGIRGLSFIHCTDI